MATEDASTGPSAPSWASATGTDRFGTWATLSIGAVTQRLRWIPPGRFVMGSPDDEPGRSAAEGPRCTVVLAEGFWLFDTPCTQALWQAVMGNNPSRFLAPSHPVEQVGFAEVGDFLARINRLIPGLDLVLPSEAAWEYACRAGTTTATHAGPIEIIGANDAPVLDPIAWYGGNSGVGFDLPEREDSSAWPAKQHAHERAGTRPVGLKAPNAWGLHDMLGNVWEWCADAWHPSHAGAPRDGSARQARDATASAFRVVRGGSWGGLARYARAACRAAADPADRDDYLGFRCASMPRAPQRRRVSALLRRVTGR